MIKIVIWGCGELGHRAYELIQNLNMDFEVVGFADTYSTKINMKKNNNDVIFKFGDVLGFYETKKLFDEGKFDGVIICIENNDSCDFVESNLQVMGIPRYALDNTRASAFQVSDYNYKIYNDKVDVAVVSNADILIKPPIFGYDCAYIIKDNKTLWESDREMCNSKSRLTMPFINPENCFALKRLNYLDAFPKKNIYITHYFDKACSLLFQSTYEMYGHFVGAVLNIFYIMEKSHFDGKYLMYDSKMARKWMKLAQKIFNIDDSRIVYIDTASVFGIHVKELHCAQNIQDTSKLNGQILHDFAKEILDNIPHISGGGGNFSGASVCKTVCKLYQKPSDGKRKSNKYL